MQLDEFYHIQLKTFELARQNYAGLQQVIYKTIPFCNYHINLQYNPARIISTNAKIDDATLKARKCFLCRENMPEDQQGMDYNEQYNIFLNPYPIFEPHFTVPSKTHTRQLITGRFEDFLQLAFDYPDYTLFYNGPQCGASAPDHFHFQIAPRHLMPLEQDAENEKIREIISKNDYYTLYSLKDYLRKVIVFKASDMRLLSKGFHRILEKIGKQVPYEEEPMINMLTWFDNCQWTVCIFPRRKRRPWQFFAEGKENIMFSPGCVDMAGLIISPRREDFERYTPELLTDLFAQVTLDETCWQTLLTNLKQN